MHRFGSYIGFCERLGCYEKATKMVDYHCLCSKHADEYIFIGCPDSKDVIDIEKKR